MQTIIQNYFFLWPKFENKKWRNVYIACPLALNWTRSFWCNEKLNIDPSLFLVVRMNMKSSLKVSDKQSIIEKLQRHCSCLNMHIIYIKKRYKKSCTLIKQPKSTESFPCFCQPFVSSYSSVIVFSPENKKYLPGKEFVCIKYRGWQVKNLNMKLL